jgi:hypothetical protein
MLDAFCRWALRCSGEIKIRRSMLTGSIRSQIDAIWQGGGFNPLSVIEQFTYLLFAKGLNDVHTREDAKAQTLCRPLKRRIYRKARTIRGGPARICAGRGSITSRRGRCSPRRARLPVSAPAERDGRQLQPACARGAAWLLKCETAGQGRDNARSGRDGREVTTRTGPPICPG